MAITVARLGGEAVVEETFDDATSFECDSNSNLVLFREASDRRGVGRKEPLIAFASGVWLSVEVV